MSTLVAPHPATPAAYALMHNGSLALAQAEVNGMRIDVDYCQKQSVELASQEEDLIKQMRNSDLYKVWRRLYGSKMKLESDPQLRTVLFDKKKGLGLTPPERRTRGDEIALDRESLLSLKFGELEPLLELRKVQKALYTYFAQILREVNSDGMLHPFFNLNTVITYRSSSDHLNFQNIPIRDPIMGAWIRRAFIPRTKDHVIVELDFGGLEVRIACCYHEDPTMIQYLSTGYDMHRAQAEDLFFLHDLPDSYWRDKKRGGMVRFHTKNGFVFPQFYGSFWVLCAKGLWYAIGESSLVDTEGLSLYQHLANHGITHLESKTRAKGEPTDIHAFETHVYRLERRLWDETFPVYRDWRVNWWKSYQTHGAFNLKTGFRIQGHLVKNDVINYPVQGAAFHCLLWAFIQMVRWTESNRMHTKIIGQIHDSIVADVHISELTKYLAKANQVMTQDIRKAWKWIVVPLEVEAEACEPGQTWHDKKKVTLPKVV